MRTRDEAAFEQRKIQIMEDCFDCYAENGLQGTGVAALAKAAGVSKAALYTYFKDLDDLIIQSTAHCMSRVENDFMSLAPKSFDEVIEFIQNIPYWTAEKHGKKYRLMYQVYTHPKYNEYGKEFFKGVDKRYTEYAKSLESSIGIPYNVITPLIFILIRACVHYALFEDKFYLQTQLDVLKSGIRLYFEHFNRQTGAPLTNAGIDRNEDLYSRSTSSLIRNAEYNIKVTD